MSFSLSSYRVDHDLIMTLLACKVKDKRLHKLIQRYLRAGGIDNQFYSESRERVPQGGPLSPLLANIMLDPLDKELVNCYAKKPMFLRIVRIAYSKYSFSLQKFGSSFVKFLF
ncbi:reverse transcriptase domain-containing protein [Aliiglaciecola sp. NS0011-25]|uniref:reverse transcriptase domain-containing protein n=1 Tax=Aliiglaciecola sp. NS0011-25 TaxID=3127654 RepID=UPI003340DC9D